MFRLVLATACVALACQFSPPSAAQPPAALAAPARWPQEVKGYGATEDAARQSAWNAAVEAVATHLRQTTPPLLDDGPLDDETRRRLVAGLKAHLLVPGPGQRGPDVELPDLLRARSWVLTYRDEPSWGPLLAAEQTAQRERRALDRQVAAGRAVGLLALGLLAAVGYVRLDDWTRRRYTPWLRAGAGAAAVALGAGWWLA